MSIAPLGHWTFRLYSDVCLRGDGLNCDSSDCACPCHGEHAPNFLTAQEVIEWHTK
jgi:hypothetical protein